MTLSAVVSLCFIGAGVVLLVSVFLMAREDMRRHKRREDALTSIVSAASRDDHHPAQQSRRYG